jgi:hypothetical protein
MSAWSPVCAPPSLSLRLHCTYSALLPHRLRDARGFGYELSPDHIRRGITRPVSYYALFK